MLRGRIKDRTSRYAPQVTCNPLVTLAGLIGRSNLNQFMALHGRLLVHAHSEGCYLLLNTHYDLLLTTHYYLLLTYVRLLVHAQSEGCLRSGHLQPESEREQLRELPGAPIVSSK